MFLNTSLRILTTILIAAFEPSFFQRTCSALISSFDCCCTFRVKKFRDYSDSAAARPFLSPDMELQPNHYQNLILRGGESNEIQVRSYVRRRPQSLRGPWTDITTCLYSTLGLAANASVVEIQAACARHSGSQTLDPKIGQCGDARRACALLLEPRLRAHYDSHRGRILAAGRRHAAAARLRAAAGPPGDAGMLEAWARSGGGEGGVGGASARWTVEPAAAPGLSAFDMLMRRPAGRAADSARPVSQSAFDVMMRKRPAPAGRAADRPCGPGPHPPSS